MSKIIYDGYKEPLVANDTGYGYIGTVAHTNDGEYIQCYECGELFKSLTVHVKKHKLTPKEYRGKYQLNSKTPLCSKNFSRKKQDIYTQVASPRLIEKQKEAQEKYQELRRKGLVEKNSTSWSMERHNKNGTCPQQILEQLRELYAKHGEVGYDYLQENHGSLLNRLIRVYGSLNKARKMAGLTTRAENTGGPPIQYTRTALLESLRDFYERNKRTPLYSDVIAENNLPSYTTFRRHFKTLNHARLESGVPILVPIANRQFVEVLPDDITSEQIEKVLL